MNDREITEGFALVASPVRAGDSGIMTFVTIQAGMIFEKNLRGLTARIARNLAQYDPDLTWRAR